MKHIAAAKEQRRGVSLICFHCLYFACLAKLQNRVKWSESLGQLVDCMTPNHITAFRSRFRPKDLVNGEGILSIQVIEGIESIEGIQGIGSILSTEGILGIEGIMGIEGMMGTEGIMGIIGIMGIDGMMGTESMEGIDGFGIQVFSVIMSIHSIMAI